MNVRDDKVLVNMLDYYAELAGEVILSVVWF